MKDEIIKLAEQQLMSGGYGKLNFANIASELETTRANLHYHFKNKENLAIAVTKAYGEREIAAFEALRNAYQGDFFGFFSAIDASFWQDGNPTDSSGPGTCTMLAIDPDLPVSLRRLSEEFYQRVEQCIIKVVRKGIEDGEIRNDVDVEREATRAHVLMMGIMTSAQHQKNKALAESQLGGLLSDWAYGLQ